MSFKTLYDNEYLEVHGGLSSEIIFGKTIANKRNVIYRGWLNKSPAGNPNFVSDSIDYVVNELKKVMNMKSKYAITGPGLDCVSYMCDLMDCVYLPTQFMVEVHNIDGLKLMLENADKSGIKCYASIMNSEIYQSNAVAYIKLMEIPKVYIDYLDSVNINRIICIGLYNRVGDCDKCKVRQYTDSDEPMQSLKPTNIYVYYPHENNGGRQIDDRYYSSKIENINMSNMKDTASYMCDWEYGFDNIPEFLINYDKKGYVFYADKKVIFNLLIYHLTHQFMHNNDVTPTGFVLNVTLIGNPFYEAINGYYSYVYDNNNQNRVIDFMNVAESQIQEFSINRIKPEFWFNIHDEDQPFTMQFPENKIILSSKLCEHLTKYKGKQITDYKRVNFCQLFQVCQIVNIFTLCV